ncbi:MAG: SelB C-terminal domain-containing protein [Betaproteobacteria bacterium]|nr:SelB C-terminal domain-containing protein [Betaproteobacteria bacterium]
MPPPGGHSGTGRSCAARRRGGRAGPRQRDRDRLHEPDWQRRVAGRHAAHGVDFVMLVVAADDGVMPQTVEHLHIIDLLQVRNGLVVITKCDRVGTQRVLQVSADVKALLAPTGLAGIPTLAVSATSGEGIDALRAALAAAARGHRRRSADGRRLRFAVDRAFTIREWHDRDRHRVRRIRRYRRTTAAYAVRNRSARPRDPAGREDRSCRAGGRALLAEPGGNPTLRRGARRLGGRSGTACADAADRCAHPRAGRRSARAESLGRHTAASWHARRDRACRAAARRKRAARPGRDGAAHSGQADRRAQRRSLHPARPGIAAHDRRRHRCRSVRPEARPRPDATSPAARRAREDRSGRGDARAGAVLARRRGRRPVRDDVQSRRRAARGAARGTEADGDLQGTADRAAAGRDRRFAADDHHDADALPRKSPAGSGHRDCRHASRRSAGADRRDVSGTAADARSGRRARLTGSVARQIRHIATDNPADLATWQRIVPLLEAAGLSGMTLTELAFDARIGEPALQDFLGRKARTADVIRVMPNRFYLKSTLAQAAAIAQAVANAQPDGKFSAAQFRDSTPIGRTRAIEILECLDRLGITRRSGEARIMCRDFTPILGPAAAASAASKAAPPTRAASPPGAARARVPIDNRGNRGNASSRHRAMHR